MSIDKSSIDSERIILDKPLNDSRITVKYEIQNDLKAIGKGGFATVFIVKKKFPVDIDPNKQYAIKKIKKEDLINKKEMLQRIITEIRIQRSLSNEYICKYENSFEDKNAIYILMEHCDKKSLAEYLKVRGGKITEIETRYFMNQVLEALKYLRRQKVVHRDLTISNIFLAKNKKIKIGDFGLSFRENENDEKYGVECGTPGYFTPESFKSVYNYKTDIFGFGVCIYHLMTGKDDLFPSPQYSYDIIYGTSNINNIDENESNNVRIPYDSNVEFTEEAKDLLSKIFKKESERIDLDEMSQHNFFKGIPEPGSNDFPDYYELGGKNDNKDKDPNKKNEFEKRLEEIKKKIEIYYTNPSKFTKGSNIKKLDQSQIMGVSKETEIQKNDSSSFIDKDDLKKNIINRNIKNIQ